eukprot:GHVN01011503.1.p1 GENE.GHVN01011503.1~~GHVN01011503.1.p1  ORF type:complete len:117 (-),score=19.91 GHVN01011503.1:465-815(-)
MHIWPPYNLGHASLHFTYAELSELSELGELSDLSELSVLSKLILLMPTCPPYLLPWNQNNSELRYFTGIYGLLLTLCMGYPSSHDKSLGGSASSRAAFMISSSLGGLTCNWLSTVK